MPKDYLDDESLFESLKMVANLNREGNMVWGNDHDDNYDDDNIVFSEDAPDDDVDDVASDSDVDDAARSFQLTFVGQIEWHWSHHKQKLEHEYAVTTWACVSWEMFGKMSNSN